jgi:hypothetical protein
LDFASPEMSRRRVGTKGVLPLERIDFRRFIQLVCVVLQVSSQFVMRWPPDFVGFVVVLREEMVGRGPRAGDRC